MFKLKYLKSMKNQTLKSKQKWINSTIHNQWLTWLMIKDDQIKLMHSIIIGIWIP